MGLDLEASAHWNEIQRMVNDQVTSIANRPIVKQDFTDTYQYGVRRKCHTFNDWVDYIFNNLNK